MKKERNCKQEFTVSVQPSGLSDGTMIVVTASSEYVKGLAGIIATLVGVKHYACFDNDSNTAIVDIPFIRYINAVLMMKEELEHGFPTINQKPIFLSVEKDAVEATLLFNTDFQSRVAPLMSDWN